MSTSTEHYHLPLYIQGYSVVTTPSRDRRISEFQKDCMVRAVNTAWDLGSHHITRPLATLLAPTSSVYTNDLTPAAVAHLNRNARYSFAWFKARDAMKASPAPPPSQARYAVAFAIVTEAPYSGLALSSMLLRFQEMFVREGNYKRFEMVDLCYMLTPRAAYGVMFFNKDFDHAYYYAKKRCDDRDDLHYAKQGLSGAITSVWNADHTTFVSSDLNGLQSHVEKYWGLTKYVTTLQFFCDSFTDQIGFRRFLLPG
ncbi:hypothetical protein FA13DRAFT_1804751 [Coprinellus micaceus]|uniref:Uncharacterized protein n=1 Tax=Coprinellus micaceus TaxID=71717 RepID=A0A4Y7S4W5_COPMI|nr:hypothetical protein FA13DRAFT_1804751 [Coprinellus micaceus]